MFFDFFLPFLVHDSRPDVYNYTMVYKHNTIIFAYSGHTSLYRVVCTLIPTLALLGIMSEPAAANSERAESPQPSDFNAIVEFSLCNPFTETLKLPDRMFQFDQRQLVIDQQWKPGGKGGTSIGFGASVYDCSVVLAYFIQSVQEKVTQDCTISYPVIVCYNCCTYIVLFVKDPALLCGRPGLWSWIGRHRRRAGGR